MKKLISFIMIFAMLFCMFSVTSSAADSTVMYGDVSGDKHINATDALIILKNSVGLNDFSVYEKAIADVDNNGVINSADALTVLMYSTKLITTLSKEDAAKNTNKARYADKAIKAGTYTVGFTTKLEDVGDDMLNGKEVDMLITSDGIKSTTKINMKITVEDLRNMGIGESDAERLLLVTTIGGSLEMRFFTESISKKYLLLNLGLIKVYSDYAGEDVGKALVSTMFSDNFIYVGTSTEKVSGVSYTCETYTNAQNALLKYYFSGTTLKMVVAKTEEGSQTFKISSFKATADKSLLKIPDGYISASDLPNE